MQQIMICLVGEQSVPNLLPIRHYKSRQVVLVCSATTKRVSDNLERLLEGQFTVFSHEVPPYDIVAAQKSLAQYFHQQGWQGTDFLFNLTGGTKPMALAAFLLAFQFKSDFLYFQTESGHSKLYCYGFGKEGQIELKRTEELPETITLDDHLRMYVGNYNTGIPRNDFEKQVHNVLQAIPGIEVLASVRPQSLGALEVDFVVRLGNQVGVVEAKIKGAKSGIDQINAVAEQRYLGTYVRKFLISGKPIDRNNRNLAQAYEIEVIELPSYDETGTLSAKDRQRLVQHVLNRLGGAS